MKKIIMTKGLPASGKSTWAKRFVDERTIDYGERWKRINKDDLRAMLDNSKWSRVNEEFVLFIRDTIAVYALKNGVNIIVDDTNFAPKHEERFKAMAKEYKALFEVREFTNVSPEICIERDLIRPNSVGSRVIMQMYNQYLKPKVEPLKYDPNLSDAIVCDLDGTLALFDDNPYDRDFTKDTLNKPVADIVHKFARSGIRVFYVSGRKDKYRSQTEQWLKEKGMDYALPFMREGEDERKDVIVKKEIYEKFIKNKYNVLFVLDDRDQMVEMWRELGITCLQVAEGDF